MKPYGKYFILMFILSGCATQKNTVEEKIRIQTSPENGVSQLLIDIQKGEEFNHPSLAIWTEDLDGKYLETLFVTRYVGTGKFGHGEIKPGKWDNKPGNVRRPASLPYWAHKRNIKAPDGLFIPAPETAVPDAITGATPTGSFELKTASKIQGGKKFRILLEINQPWDSNKYWTNSKIPTNLDYFTSLQPSLIYAVVIDPDSGNTKFNAEPIGHGHPTGENGNLFTDLSTLTSAKEIIKKIVVQLPK